MKVLVNYDPAERARLPVIASILKKLGITAVANKETFGISDLLAAAKKTQADAIVLCNEDTLPNLVQTITKSQATLSNFRGSRLNFSVPVIVTSPLAHLNTVTYGKFLFDRDLAKLLDIKKRPIGLKFKVCETPELLYEAAFVLGECIFISIDIETDAYSRITCIAFTGLTQRLTTTTYVIPFIDFGRDHFSAEMYSYAIETMQTICKNYVPKMFFNGNYDVQYLIKYHAYPNNWVIDVMGLAQCQFSELPKALDFVCSLWVYDYYYWKLEDELAKKNKDIRGYWGYCAKDSWYPVRIFLEMIKHPYPDYAITNYQMLFKICYPYLYAAYEGLRIDENERLKAREEASSNLEVALDNLRKMAFNKNFNPSSPKQVGTFIYDIIGAKQINGKSTDKRILDRVAQQHPLLSRIISDVSTFREERKAIGTYFDFAQYKMPNGEGRLLYSISPFTTDTGRSSSKQSNFRTVDEDGDVVSYGNQIQNTPDYAKAMYIADEGFELGEADNNKSEARCVAVMSNCKGLIDALNDKDRDFYRSLGTTFFGLPYEQVTKEMRNDILKHIVHAYDNMGGVDAFINNAGLQKVYEGAALLNYPIKDPKKFVAYLLGKYDKAFPEISRNFILIKREILRTNKLVSPMGYTRYFFGDIINDHKVLRAACAHQPQNLSVTILNKGLWKIYKELVLKEEGRFRLKAQIHDSLFVQWVKEKREEYIKRMLELMNNPIPANGHILSIPVDCKFGRSWKQVKES